ncbi:MAG: CBS-domain-containing membrane protein [Chloroflexi bacterium]|nr:MAG: CBS-domain-containing membrane protein [Chloroflexota bacterium]
MRAPKGFHLPHPDIHLPHLTSPHGFLPHVLDQYIHSRWNHYFLQCCLATIALILILIIGDTLKTAIIVGIASSTFTIFVVPNSVAATPRKVIGGHLLAAFTGTLIALILQSPPLIQVIVENRYLLDAAAALSVGVGIFLMVVTNTEHPPAAGTSLGLVIQCCDPNIGVDWPSIIFIMISATLLSGVRIALRDKMVNLL